jgi:hypothetical protein
MSGARIEVFQHDINDRYRQIELAGSPVDVSRAAEKIYKIVNKYYFINPNNTITSHRRDSSEGRNISSDRRRSSRNTEDKPRTRIRLMKRTRKGNNLK